MAETRASLYRTLAALALTSALAGCAATHVGDDWQCPLAQGEVCTSIAAADPAVVPERTPPQLATRTPLYRTPETEAVAPEAETGTTTEPGAEPRPCAEGCNPFALLGRMLAPRAATAVSAETEETVSTTPRKETPAPVAITAPHETPCGTGQPAPEPDAGPMNTEDEAEPMDDAGTPCPIAAEAQSTATSEPIASSTTAIVPCGTDDVPATPAEASVETAGEATDAPLFDGVEAPCTGPVPVEKTAAAETAERAVTSAENVTTPAVAVDPPPPALVPPPSAAPDALRTGEVVGRIWIAPFVDAGGVYREGAWVRAVLAPARWRR